MLATERKFLIGEILKLAVVIVCHSFCRDQKGFTYKTRFVLGRFRFKRFAELNAVKSVKTEPQGTGKYSVLDRFPSLQVDF